MDTRHNGGKIPPSPPSDHHNITTDLHPAPLVVAAEMKEAAGAFVAGLHPSQRRQCVFSADGRQRFNWDYRPGKRAGLPLSAMEDSQRLRALALLVSGLSRSGGRTAFNIMSLEKILGSIEGSGNHRRDPGLYYVTIFGEPSLDSAWGWRIEGHHLSVNFRIAKGGDVFCCPSFFGANPATVPEGPLQGFLTLPREEQVARELLATLGEEQRRRACVSSEAPGDIVTGWASHIELDEPVGIPAQDFNAEQHQALLDLLEVYVGRMTAHVAEEEMAQIDKEGVGSIHFAWAGSTQRGHAHYYRLHGPSTVVEYDNIQNNANHIHSVWRNLKRDWGGDLLRDHYAQSHSSQR